MRCTTVCFASILGLALPALTATADEGVAILETCSDADLQAFADGVARELHGEARPLDSSAPCTPPTDTRHRQVLEAGRRAFEGLDVDGAVQTLRSLLADIERAPHFTADFQIAREAHTYLAWIALERHDTAAARAYFDAACALDPDWHPNTTQFPPHVTSELMRVCSSTKSTVPISTSEKATLRVDTYVCHGPCAVTVPPGRHFVVLDDGWVRREAVLQAKEALIVPLSLEPTADERIRNAVQAADLDALQPALVSSKADSVIVLDAKNAVTSALVVRAPYSHLVGPLPLDAGDVPGSAALLRTELATWHEPPPPPTPVYRRWWFWTAAGVVAAGATVGIIAAARHTRHFDVATTLP